MIKYITDIMTGNRPAMILDYIRSTGKVFCHRRGPVAILTVDYRGFQAKHNAVSFNDVLYRVHNSLQPPCGA